ncbi:hypothetical protein K1719_026236 [Acacia pycnantha]|nr:hypothetical protein K1719_026236 [Acacia pycnantha]
MKSVVSVPSTKEDAPPPTTDCLRSTKKVRIRPDGVDGGLLDGADGLVDPDVRMTATEPPEVASYRSKLLNMGTAAGSSRPRGEVVVSEKDYLIRRDGDFPSIEFSKEVRAALVKGMERTLVIKLLGRSITYGDLMNRTQTLWHLKGSYQLVDLEGSFFLATFDLEEDYSKVLTGGPWTIFGAYLTVQPWTVDFDSKTATISTAVVWVRVPGLSFSYYHKSTLRAIGRLLGEVVKIDYMTENRGCGRYARIAILTDLQQPLVPWIMVDGKTYGVEYEGLPLICFTCGKYGHTKEKCKKGQSVDDGGVPIELNAQVVAPVHAQSDSDSTGAAANPQPEQDTSPFGSWMQVRYSKKGNRQYKGKEVKGGGPFNAGGSRYNVLFDYTDMGADSSQLVEGDQGKMSGGGSGQGLKNLIASSVRGPVTISGPSASVQPKHGSTKIENGGPKIIQEYRRKVPLDGQTANINDKPNVVVSQQPSSVVGPCINEEVNCKDSIPIETHPTTAGVAGQEVSSFLHSAFHAMEAVSTLDKNKHTVVELHRNRKTLEEVNPNTSTMGSCISPLQNTLVVGKENSNQQPLSSKPVQHGIKLQSSIKRNLKVRRKKEGMQISKDAIEAIREEFGTPSELGTVAVCSLEQGARPDEGDDDATGSGMVV